MNALRVEAQTVEPNQRPAAWSEVAAVVAFYLVYTWIRNQFGSAAVDADVAYRNAEYVIDFERAIGSYVEADVQSWFLDAEWFIRLNNIFYGTLHFIVTIGTLVYLYLRQPQHYRLWRTVGLTTTGLALIGFALFPLMPPRLLSNCRPIGACVDSPIIDTMAETGGLWSFDSGTMESISNQYAAMPSLHIAWATWSMLALTPHLTSRIGRIFMIAYPTITLFTIVVTGNHYWIDAVGGLVVLAVAHWIGTRWPLGPIYNGWRARLRHPTGG